MVDERQRSSWIRWARTLGVVAAIVALIAVAGGFAEAPEARRSAAVGSLVDNGRRVWVVRGAELTTTAVRGYDIEPSLRVRVTITNTGRTSDAYLDAGVVEVVTADGRILGDVSWRSYPRAFALFPDIPVDVYAEMEVDPAWMDGPVTVRIHDEEPSRSSITTSTWRVAVSATDVITPVNDVRHEP